MNNHFLITLLLLSAGFLSNNAASMDISATFNTLDKDDSGTLNKTEAKEDAVLHENFTQVDTNQDGLLSLNEFKIFIQ